jgi:hypothetical protein
MLSKKDDYFLDLKNNISKEAKIAKEIAIFLRELEKKENSDDRKMIEWQLKSLKKEMIKINDNIILSLNQNATNPLVSNALKPIDTKGLQNLKITERGRDFVGRLFLGAKGPKVSVSEKETLKRLKKKEQQEKTESKKIIKPSTYVRKANQLFSDFSFNLVKKYGFRELQSDLIKANLNILLRSYISITIFTTIISVAVSFFVFIFLLFFNVGFDLPIVILSNEDLVARFLKTFWIVIIVPAVTFISMYVYPSLEKDSLEKKINHELPFATINMAAISGSMIDPTKIFSIIISTGEYPYLEKEFRKLLNTVNVLGQDFVSALNNSTFNCSSRKLSELFNGLATTMNSGGDLPKFFQERAETMLFEYRLEREKETKTAETFMDIYISVVIAAPMILMLLLMMMRISGLGISLSTGMITLIMVLGVTMINIAFLTFLQIKQSNN